MSSMVIPRDSNFMDQRQTVVLCTKTSRWNLTKKSKDEIVMFIFVNSFRGELLQIVTIVGRKRNLLSNMS